MNTRPFQPAPPRLAAVLKRASLIAGLALTGWASHAQDQAQAQDLSAAARRGAALYRDGQLPGHAPLTARRSDGNVVTGAAAACIQCHRGSGMGGAEGAQLIPPVQGALLFAPGQPTAGAQPRSMSGIARQLPAHQTRPAYTAGSLRAALNEGRGADGGALGGLMPRYALSEAQNADLIAYLDTLGAESPPGVDTRTVHLATVIDMDAPDRRRQALQASLSACLGDEVMQSVPVPEVGLAAVQTAADATSVAKRRWVWHAWPVQGAPETWPAQLARHQSRQPVLALISGLSDRAWQPVQAFCERERMPCLLPSAPGVDPLQPSDWSFHFTRGVALEAALIAGDLAGPSAPSAVRGRLFQLVDGSEVAALGARVLAQRLNAPLSGRRTLPASHAAAVVAGLRRGDHLVLWLSAPVLASLPARLALPAGVSLHVSGELGGLDDLPLPRPWRDAARVSYTYQPADRRIGRQILNAGALLRAQGDALQPDLVLLQGNAYSACEMGTRALRMMGQRVSRTRLLELFEASDESALAVGFPRFTLGPGQRVGSRGGYLMRFDSERPGRLLPVGDWQVPDWSDIPDAKP